MSPKFKTIEEAENEFGLTVEAILDGEPKDEYLETSASSTLSTSTLLLSHLKTLTPDQLQAIVKEGLGLLQPKTVCNVLSDILSKFLFTNQQDVEHVVLPMFSSLTKDVKIAVFEKLFADLSSSVSVISNCSRFISLSIEAMQILQKAKKHNLIYKWSQCIVGENGTPLISLNRMPFGLIEYQLEFFTATNVMQVGKFLYLYGTIAHCI